MKETQLHELLAVDKTRQKEAEGVFKETSQVFKSKPNLFQGKQSSYEPLAEDEQKPEPEHVEMVTTVPAKIDYLFGIVGRALDVTASKDATNQQARADVVIEAEDGGSPHVLLANVPATTLLHLETQLARWSDLFRSIPTLAPGRKWELDPDQGDHIYRDQRPYVKTRTKKTIQHKILVEPTEHHPAQVEKWSEDVVIGNTTEVNWSGMLTPADKSRLIGRTQDVLAAVKAARQRANCTAVQQVSVAKSLVDYITG